MKVESFYYDHETGWSVTDFPALDSTQTVVFIFGASEYVDVTTPFEDLKKAYPTSIMAGCSTSGEIFQAIIHDKSLTVAVVKFAHTEVKFASETISHKTNSLEAGMKLASQLHSQSLSYVMVFSEGLTVNGSHLVSGLKRILHEHVAITGGLAGDADNFASTWVIDEHMPQTHTVTAVGFYGDSIDVNYASKGGWDIFGPERVITRAEGSIVYEIDGEPALQLYKKYLGERASGLPATALLFPLAIREHRDSKEQVVRTILAVDENSQSMTFAGDVPQGWHAQLMKANYDRLIEGAAQAGKLAHTLMDKDDSPMLAIAISCVGRRLVLGERSEEEIEATLDSLPEHTQQIGFYSYGEISPTDLRDCDLHNQTMTLTTIREK